MSTGEPQPAVTSDGQGWTQGSTDQLIELAHRLLAAAKDHAVWAEPIPGWGDAYTKFEDLYQAWIKRDAEETCHRCGRDFIFWTAPSPLWNEVMRAGDINHPGAEPYRGIVCPTCFMLLAEKAGVATSWRVYGATVFRHLQTVTPEGRVWNPQTWLFDDPAEAVPAADNVVHGFTLHGHPCCGQVAVGDRPGNTNRCGGARRCDRCAAWARQIHLGQITAVVKGPAQ